MRFIICSFLFAAPFALPAFAGHYEIRTVAYSGQTRPGSSNGESFGSFGFPSLSNSGLVAFPTDRGVYAEASSGELRPVVQIDDGVPGIPGSEFKSFLYTWINDAGEVTFDGEYTANSPRLRGIWSEIGGSGLNEVIRDAVPIPNIGTVYHPWSLTNVNDDGVVSMFSRILVATGNPDQVLFRMSDGLGSPITFVPDEAPGLGESLQFTYIIGASMNNDGRVVFKTILTDPDNNFERIVSLWKTDDELELELLLKERDAGLQAPNGEEYRVYMGSPAISNRDEVAFLATSHDPLTNPGISRDDLAIWVRRENGEYELVVEQGAPSSELAAGETIGWLFTAPKINDAGHVAFGSLVTGHPPATRNENSIWVSSPDEEPKLIIRSGDLIEVEEGDYREVSVLWRTGRSELEDGTLGSHKDVFAFNNAGDIAFSAEFTDGTAGVFLASQVIPEPSALGISTLFVVWQIVLRRPRERPHASG